GKHLGQLERAADAATGDQARAMAGDVRAVEADLPTGGPDIPGTDIDEGCLAGAVLAHDRQPLAGHQVEVDGIGRDNAAERQRQPPGRQQSSHAGLLARRCRSTRPNRPAGATNTITISTRPSTSCHAPVSSAAAYSLTNSNTKAPTKAPTACPDPPRMAMKTISPERTQ